MRQKTNFAYIHKVMNSAEHRMKYEIRKLQETLKAQQEQAQANVKSAFMPNSEPASLEQSLNTGNNGSNQAD